MNKHSILRFVAHQIVIALLVVTTTLTTSRGRADDKPAQRAPTYVDLQDKATQKLSDSLHGFDGNDLAELPKGEQDFGGVRFKVGDGYLRLSGTVENGDQPKKPGKVEGIAIGRQFTRLRILHGTGYGEVADPFFVKDGTVIGEYRLRYEDGTAESIPIVYGQDVRDWWARGERVKVSRGTVAWTGKNSFAREQKEDQTIHLYLTTWSNPHPEKKVVSLDYVCTETSAASPFCIAISLEEK
jgi:hypothetical protein